jgi:hypothetical protein
MTRVKVAIAVAEDELRRLHEVAEACRALGFEHDTTLPRVGVLTGAVDVDTLPALRAIPGVVAIEIGRVMRPSRRNN